MKYVFRLSAQLKDKLTKAGRSRAGKQSAVVRDALDGFLKKKPRSLADRPKLRGTEYKQVCVLLDDAQIEEIKRLYPDVSISVVIQAAVLSELRKPRYKIAGSAGKPTAEHAPTETALNEETESDGNEHAAGDSRQDQGDRGED